MCRSPSSWTGPNATTQFGRVPDKGVQLVVSSRTVFRPELEMAAFGSGLQNAWALRPVTAR